MMTHNLWAINRDENFIIVKYIPEKNIYQTKKQEI